MKCALILALVSVTAACGAESDRTANGEAAAARSAAADQAGQGVATGLLPGQWEVSTEVTRVFSKVESDLGPITIDPIKQPVQSYTTCRSAKEDPRPFAKLLTGENKNCDASNLRVAGGRISGTVQCREANATTQQTMDGRYTPTAYRVTTKMRIEGTSTQKLAPDLAPAKVRSIEERTSVTTARRLGDCQAAN